MWESTLLVFVSDNGGPTNGNEGTSSNNFPMRGGKNTLWSVSTPNHLSQATHTERRLSLSW